MSYDMGIGSESFNYTYNVADMWYDCYEKGIREHYGLSGEESIPVLRKLREHMEDNIDKLEAMNPENGWGNYDGAVEFVGKLILAAMRNKHEIWEGDL